MKARKVLLVVDMQNDFVTGALANRAAENILERIADRIAACRREGAAVFFTRDTHGEDYLNTQEGRMLPVPHCIEGTDGWQIVSRLRPYAAEEDIFDKRTFGSLLLPQWIQRRLGAPPEEIELCGVCTDICVIANALILKSAFPEVPVRVFGSRCAGVTPDSHACALEAMRACQVIVEE